MPVTSVISRLYKTDNIKTVCVRPPGAFGAETVKAVSVKEGTSVALRTGETEIKREDIIQWMFGEERMLLAEIHLKNKIFETYDSDDGRFKGKLELDKYTGSLIIHNTKSSLSGVYHMKIIKKSATIYKRFDVDVSGGSEYICVNIKQC